MGAPEVLADTDHGPVDPEFSEFAMADVMAEFYDGPHATPPPADSGPVYLGIKNLTDGGRLDLSSVRHIAEADFERWTKRVTPAPGDVVFTYEATLHRYALIPEGFHGCLGRRLALIRPRRDRVDPKFLHFVLLGPEWRSTVEDRVISGATVDRIPIIDFPKFPIRLPPLPAQRRIAVVLSAFDELIEINERRIELLEDLARSLYREWFVNFRFPGHEEAKLVDSELGLVPEGWAVASIEEVAPGVTRGIAPKYADDGSWTVINQRCIRNQRVNLTPSRRHEGRVSDAKRLQFADVLINSTGVGTLGRAAILLEATDTMTADSHVTIVRASSPEFQPWFGLQLLSRESEFQGMGTGSTGQTELGRTEVGELPVAVPPAPVRQAFAECTWPLLRPIPTLARLSDALANARDLLLPRLVTGKLDISEIGLGVLEPTEVD